MSGKTIAQLETVEEIKGDDFILFETVEEIKGDDFILSSNNSGKAGKLTIKSFSEKMWENMYIYAKAVIISCKWCGSHNAISNSTCIRCGGPLSHL